LEDRLEGCFEGKGDALGVYDQEIIWSVDLKVVLDFES